MPPQPLSSGWGVRRSGGRMASATHGETVQLELGCRFDHVAEVDVPAVAIVEPHSSLREASVDERWGGSTVERYEDVDGNRCRRLVLPAGASSFSYTATVRVSPEPDEVPG